MLRASGREASALPIAPVVGDGRMGLSIGGPGVRHRMGGNVFALVPRGAGRAWLAQSASAIKRRARIHHIYYLLAAFDLAAVVSGLFLTHHVNLVLANTVKANLAWSALHDKVAELRRGAGHVNAPGNDVFESRDASLELGRFDAA